MCSLIWQDILPADDVIAKMKLPEIEKIISRYVWLPLQQVTKRFRPEAVEVGSFLFIFVSLVLKKGIH